LSEDDINNGGWKEWSKYVIKELERLGCRDDIQEEKITNLRINVEKISTQMKERGAMWGFAAGVIATAITELILFFAKNFF